ncbi:MAG: ComEA family DNA-binding protein [Patescibacteria group bacterium]|nr:ComEA family DNA-binding protein [Patescibacteria group bacterium]
MIFLESISTLWKRYPGEVAGFGIAVVLLISSAVLLFRSSSPGAVPETEITVKNNPVFTTEARVRLKQALAVDVSGAVASPGVYLLPEGSRIADAIEKAGGLSARADKLYIERDLNRARTVIDQEKLFIPEYGQAPVRVEPSSPDLPEKASVDEPVLSVVDINTATAAELEALPGIGPKTAQAIIENRPYDRIETLREEKILSARTYEAVLPSLGISLP